MHKASDTLTTWIYNLSFAGKPLYALKADIHQYFKSIDHERLKRIIRRGIKDPETLGLLDLIIDSGGEGGKGIPVGNLTSQLFANIYLDTLDKFIKETLCVKHYMRYMDDFVILSPDKAYLRELLQDIEAFLCSELALQLNPKTAIFNSKNGIDFCGYRHWPDHKKVRKSSVKRMRKRIKRYRKGWLSKEQLDKSYQSWLGHVQHADTHCLRGKMAAEIEKVTT